MDQQHVFSPKASEKLPTGNGLTVNGSQYFLVHERKIVLERLGEIDTAKKRLNLGKSYCGEYLTEKEISVAYHIFLGRSASQIANILSRSRRTIEFHINQIKTKLQCESLGDVISVGVGTGLAYSIFLAQKAIECE